MQGLVAKQPIKRNEKNKNNYDIFSLNIFSNTEILQEFWGEHSLLVLLDV